MRSRSEHDLDRVRHEWVERYNVQLRALRVLGLSVGTPKDDIAQRYALLRVELEHHPDMAGRLDEIDEAFDALRGD